MKRFIYFAAATMAVSGMSGVGLSRALADDQTPGNGGAVRAAGDNAQNTIDRVTSTTQPAPGQALTERNMKEVRDTIQTAVQAALTKGGFNNFVDRFTKADRDRLGKAVSNDHPDLDGIVAQIQKDWQDKYHEDFKMQKPELVFSNAQFIQGDNADNARMAGERLPAVQQQNQDVANQNNGKTDVDRASQNMATVILPAAANGDKQLTIHAVAEGTVINGWKLKIPDQVTYDRLHDNLSRELTAIKDSKANWPSDVNEAYRIVTYRIMNAAYDAGTTADHMNRTAPAPTPSGAQ